MKYKLISASAFAVLILTTLQITAFANSSWIWFTSVRPHYLLPAFAIITILAEAFAINGFPTLKNFKKTVCVVSLANLVSFLLPYAAYMLEIADETATHNKSMTLSDVFSAAAESLEKVPFYTVNVIFLILTLAAEVPIVYNILKNGCANRRRLLITVIAANVITTLAAAVTERILCIGRW